MLYLIGRLSPIWGDSAYVYQDSRGICWTQWTAIGPLCYYCLPAGLSRDVVMETAGQTNVMYKGEICDALRTDVAR